MSSPAKNLLEKAKFNLMYPKVNRNNGCPMYYATVLLSLKEVWTEDCPTAGVDGRNLYLNENFILSLNGEELVGLLAHEAGHIFMRHIDEFPFFNKKELGEATERKLWNIAGDHVINLGLHQGGYTLPQGALMDGRFRDKTTQQVYDIIHAEFKKEQKQAKQKGQGEPSPDSGPLGDDVIQPDTMGKSDLAVAREYAEIREHTTSVLASAATVSRNAKEKLTPGNSPCGADRIINDIFNPVLPFEVLLGNYLTEYSNNADYSYQRPNKRFLPDYYLPSSYSETLCNISCIFDVSGSVDADLLSFYASCVQVIGDTLKPDKISLVSFDNQITEEFTYCPAREKVSSFSFKGGGGTNIHPVLEWIQEKNPRVTVIFTDGYFYHPQQWPELHDIIWILIDRPGDWANDLPIPIGKIFRHLVE